MAGKNTTCPGESFCERECVFLVKSSYMTPFGILSITESKKYHRTCLKTCILIIIIIIVVIIIVYTVTYIYISMSSITELRCFLWQPGLARIPVVKTNEENHPQNPPCL
jgi:hypothetical protein